MDKCYPGQHPGCRIEVIREFNNEGGDRFTTGEQGTIDEEWNDGSDDDCAMVRMDDGRCTWVSGHDVILIN